MPSPIRMASYQFASVMISNCDKVLRLAGERERDALGRGGVRRQAQDKILAGIGGGQNAVMCALKHGFGHPCLAKGNRAAAIRADVFWPDDNGDCASLSCGALHGQVPKRRACFSAGHNNGWDLRTFT